MHLFRAKVTSTSDPKHLGRVCVSLSDLTAQTGGAPASDTTWLRVIQVSAGKDHGHLFLPEVGDQVLVLGADGGDTHQMYVLGALYHGDAKPPSQADDRGNPLKQIRTPGGNALSFSDKPGHEYTQIKAGKTTLTLYADGRIRMQSPSSVAIEAPLVTINGKPVNTS